MTPTPTRRGRRTALALALLGALLVPGLAQLPAVATGSAVPAAVPGGSVVTPGDSVPGLDDLDARGTALPSAGQRAAVSQLGAVDVRWNRFGTPSSLLPADGSLGRATSSDPVAAARAWLEQHAAVFGLSTGQAQALTLVRDQHFAQSPARAVLFRQSFDGLVPALDSMVTVGGAGGLDGVHATTSDGWTTFSVPGFAQPQQARLRVLAMADGTVRPVFETNVVDTEKGSAFAYTLMVDATDGTILHRQNQVENNNDAYPFQGEVTATDCGPKHEFELTDGQTRRIDAVAAMANSADDIVVKIFDPQGGLLVSGDVGTSPETASYTADSIPAGIYSLQVCPYGDPTVPFTPPGSYAAAVTTSDTTTPGTDASLPVPQWRHFTANQ